MARLFAIFSEENKWLLGQSYRGRTPRLVSKCQRAYDSSRHDVLVIKW